MLKAIAKQLSRRQDGFTLIELMVVVAILAVLAFLVLPKALDALNKSKLNSAQSVANEIANAMERQAAQNGEASKVQYPPAQTGTGAIIDNNWDSLVTAVAGVAKVPDANTATKYFQGTGGNITFAYTTNGNQSDYAISLTAQDNLSTEMCIRPGGVTVGNPTVASCAVTP